MWRGPRALQSPPHNRHRRCLRENGGWHIGIHVVLFNYTRECFSRAHFWSEEPMSTMQAMIMKRA